VAMPNYDASEACYYTDVGVFEDVHNDARCDDLCKQSYHACAVCAVGFLDSDKFITCQSGSNMHVGEARNIHLTCLPPDEWCECPICDASLHIVHEAE
jgi:hypothetical protein